MSIAFVQSVNVAVSDQERALAWYVQKLGLEKRDDTPMGDGLRWLEVAPPGGQTVIVLAQRLGRSATDAPGADTGVVLETADIAATYEELSGRGVNFDDEPRGTDSWGYQAVLRDPDGNSYLLHQRGHGGT